ncbi:MAG: glycosyltransferase [Pseudomonadota bacterium]
MVWSVCIFAHNEALLLPDCLNALDAAADGGDYVAHVIENGSHDDTAQVARAYASADKRIHVHELPVGDKANAWNDYVHRIAGEAEAHIFIDGDVRPMPRAFRGLAGALQENDEAYGAAALPATGRSRQAWAERLFDEHYISGNLYALSGDAINQFRTRPFHFPFGAVGEDGLLTYVLLTDLEGGTDDTHKNRIAVATDAFFEFDSLRLSPHDLKIYWNRLRRYSRRYIQNAIMYPMLKERGLAALPDKIDTIFTAEALSEIPPRTDFVNAIVDRRMLRELKARAAN